MQQKPLPQKKKLSIIIPGSKKQAQLRREVDATGGGGAAASSTVPPTPMGKRQDGFFEPILDPEMTLQSFQGLKDIPYRKKFFVSVPHDFENFVLRPHLHLDKKLSLVTIVPKIGESYTILSPGDETLVRWIRTEYPSLADTIDLILVEKGVHPDRPLQQFVYYPRLTDRCRLIITPETGSQRTVIASRNALHNDRYMTHRFGTDWRNKIRHIHLAEKGEDGKLVKGELVYTSV